MRFIAFLSILVFASPAFAGWNPAGPYGGVITSVAVVKEGVYAGTEGGGVFFSNDGGKSWEGRGKGLQSLFVESLAVSKEGGIYAGTRDGVYKSRDGKAWELLQSLPRGSAVRNMVFDSEGNLHASLWGSGVFICKKDSDCANPRKDLSSLFVNTILPRENGDVVLATEGGIFRKPKGEERWKMDGLLEYMVPAIALDGNGVLYAGTWGGGIHYFDKNDWNYRSLGVSSSMTAVLARGSDGNLYAGTEGGLSMISPGATQWTRAGLDNIYVKSLGFGPKGEIFAGSYGRGFWAREKGKEWESRNKGIYNSNILSIAVSDKGEVFAGTRQGLHMSLKGDGNWVEVDDLYGMKVHAFLFAGGRIFAGTSNGLFVGGVSEKGWKRVAGDIGYFPVTSLATDGSFIYAGTDSDGIFKGTADTGNWLPFSEGLDNVRVRSLVSESGNIYAGTYEGVYALQKGKGRWSLTGLKEDVIVSLTVGGGTVFAAAENKGVYAMKDGKWVLQEAPTPNKRILSVHHSGKTLYASGYGWMIFREGDGPWKEMTGELSNTVIQTVTTDRTGKAYAGTWGGGIWRME